MEPAYISSVGLSPIGTSDLPGRDLFSIALAEAFESLPNPAEIVDAMYVGAQSERYENQIMLGSILAEWAGLRHIPAERVEACAAAGALALKHAVRDVRTGVHDAVLACGVEKMTTGGTEGATNALAAAFDRPLEQRSGVTAPSQYALLAQRYLHENTCTERDLGSIAVKNHQNATQNPRAMFRNEISIDAVMDSEYIAPPIKLYDCAPVCDGAAVVLVTNRRIRDELGTSSVTVEGVGSTVNNIGVADRNLSFLEGAHSAAAAAYDAAGMKPTDIDIAELHDAFTICEAMLAEACGFAPRGTGWQSARRPSERDEGWSDVEINTSGGLKARGHPIGATGLAQAVEAYEQLTGQTTTAHQRSQVETALLLNEGGLADAATTVHILRSTI